LYETALKLTIAEQTVETGDICHCHQGCYLTLSSADCSLPDCNTNTQTM